MSSRTSSMSMMSCEAQEAYGIPRLDGDSVAVLLVAVEAGLWGLGTRLLSLKFGKAIASNESHFMPAPFTS